jgi:hypothetical protein
MNLKGCFYEKKVIMGGKIQEWLGRMDPAAKKGLLQKPAVSPATGARGG